MQDFPSTEQLMELARSNPEELERIRQQGVEALITSAPEQMQRRLRGLQFQIDCKRQRHQGNPLGACVAITDMMLDSLQRLNNALHGEHPQTPSPRVSREETSSVVAPFPRTTDRGIYLHLQ